jgi:hypothetical protein
MDKSSLVTDGRAFWREVRFRIQAPHSASGFRLGVDADTHHLTSMMAVTFSSIHQRELGC